MTETMTKGQEASHPIVQMLSQLSPLLVMELRKQPEDTLRNGLRWMGQQLVAIADPQATAATQTSDGVSGPAPAVGELPAPATAAEG